MVEPFPLTCHSSIKFFECDVSSYASQSQMFLDVVQWSPAGQGVLNCVIVNAGVKEVGVLLEPDDGINNGKSWHGPALRIAMTRANLTKTRSQWSNPTPTSRSHHLQHKLPWIPLHNPACAPLLAAQSFPFW